MKTIQYYINEKLDIKGNSIIVLSNYIIDLLDEWIHTPADDEHYKNYLHELIVEEDNDVEYEINFSDIEGFDVNKYRIASRRLLLGDNFDLLLNLTNTISGFGTFDKEDCMIQVNTKFLKDAKNFEKHKSEIRNTLIHELTHMVQYCGDFGLHMLSQKSANVTAELKSAIEDKQLAKYYLVNFIMYAFDPTEMDARKMGFYGTMMEEFDGLYNKYMKKHKTFNVDDFTDFVINQKRYENNILHLNAFNTFIDDLKKDTFDKYVECVIDEDNQFREDSMMYVFLKSAECVCAANNVGNVKSKTSITPPFPMPAKDINCYVGNLCTEKRYEQYKDKLIKYCEKHLNNYKHKLSKIVKQFVEEFENNK